MRGPKWPTGLLSTGPVMKGSHWTRFVNGVETEAELKALRNGVARGPPFGDPAIATDNGHPTWAGVLASPLRRAEKDR